MSLSREAKRLLAALYRGETVSRGFGRGWTTSDGEPTEGHAVYALVRARLAEYCEWGTASTGNRIGTKARLKAPPAKEAA